MPEREATGFNSLMAPRGGILPAAAIVAITLLAYLPAMSGGFFSDDYAFLPQNPLIQAPDGLRRFWLTTEAPDYFPVTSSMLWLEWRLWSDHPAGYHVVNVLLHAAGAVLLWRVLRRLAVPGAWLAGALFAVHPVAAASAAWITELKNTLSLVFCAASLLAFLKFDEKAGESECRRFGNGEMGKVRRRKESRSRRLSPSKSPNSPISQFAIYLLSVILFLFALLSKTSVVMLPVILLLCAWWRRGRISRKDFLRSLPFFALSLALGLLTIWFQRQKAIHGWTVRPEGMASRVAAAGWIIWFYLYKILLPAGLCAIYPRWNVDGSSVIAFLPLLLLLAGMVFLWARRKSWGRAPFFALAYFLVMLLPVLGFVDMLFMGLSLVADHLQYLAMIGIIALAAALLARASSAPGLKGRAAILATVGCVAALGVFTRDRASLYAHAEALWQDNLAKNPAASVWNARANEYDNAGRPDKAVQCFDRAIELGFKLPEVYFNRGNARAKLNRFPEAIADFDAAIALQPDYPEAFNGRACACASLGRFDPALRDCNKAIELKPDFATAYFNRANIWATQGRLDEAIRDYSKAIALKPDYARAYDYRAVIYYQLREFSKAWADVKMSEKLGGRLDPEFVKALEQAAPRPE